MRLAFDIEANDLLENVTTIHCLNIEDVDTGERWRFNDKFADASGSILDGVKLLQSADLITGHNIIGYDLPALNKILGATFDYSRIFDTLVASRVIWTNIKDIDYAKLRKGKYPPEFTKNGLLGSHKLEAWGYRLGEYKGDFKGPWDEFTEEMDDYCAQDVNVTVKLFKLIESKEYSPECLQLEHQVASIIHRQCTYGFKFDERGAEELYQELTKRRIELEDKCRDIFPPWYVPDGKGQEYVREDGTTMTGRGLFVPKRDNKSTGYVKGAPLTKLKRVLFNPSSRDHIADRLMTVFGWEPVEFTEGGKPKVDETTLEPLTYPSVDLITEYLMLTKRCGQIHDGDNGWLKKVGPDGRIHGYVNSNGAVTGRMTHNSPNVAQVPASGSPYGEECRSLFTVPKGKKLVGCDAEGLELRCLGHYMARYDKGKYAHAVVHGDKKDGTDAHTLNKVAIGLNTRDSAKTWFLIARNLSGKPVKRNPVNSGEVSLR